MTATTRAHVARSDDAALFPAGSVPTARAVPAHRQRGARPGRPAGLPVVPVARVDDLVALEPLPAPDRIPA